MNKCHIGKNNSSSANRYLETIEDHSKNIIQPFPKRHTAIYSKGDIGTTIDSLQEESNWCIASALTIALLSQMYPPYIHQSGQALLDTPLAGEKEHQKSP